MKTPILLLIYNRQEYTQKVFEAIREARPEELFISADGPKVEIQGNFKLCEETRRIVNKINWPCKVKTLFRDKNLGCKLSISAGIDWFFENVSEGIILEDDCLPNKSFFRYCEMLLEKYRNEEGVMMISGSNPAVSLEISGDYFFSCFYTIWGWATWKRSWNKFDINMHSWPQFKQEKTIKKVFSGKLKNQDFTERMFDSVYNNKKSSVWSLQWVYACIENESFVILPKNNLICNIGLIGTHEMNNNQLFLKTEEIDFDKFSHPPEIKLDPNIEDLLFKKSGLN